MPFTILGWPQIVIPGRSSTIPIASISRAKTLATHVALGEGIHFFASERRLAADGRRNRESARCLPSGSPRLRIQKIPPAEVTYKGSLFPSRFFEFSLHARI